MTRPTLLFLCALAAGLVDGGEVRAADAGPPAVIVLRPPDADYTMVEVANRTQAELIASGWPARLIRCEEGRSSCVDLDDRAVSVTVTTFRQSGEVITEVRWPGHARGEQRRRILSKSLRKDGTAGVDEPSILAIRAVELVRATLLSSPRGDAGGAAIVEGGETASLGSGAEGSERGAPAGPGGPASPAGGDAGAARLQPPAAAAQSTGPGALAPEVTAAVGWSIGGGGAVLESVHGFSAAYALLLRVGYRGRRGLSGSLLAAGPGFTSDQPTAGGSLRTRQELVAIELGYAFRRHAPVQPRLTLGLGAHHIAVRAPLETGAQADASGFSALVSAGAGVLLVLGRHVALFFDAQALFTEPSAAQVVRGASLSRLGQPSLLVSLGVQRLF